MLPLTASQRRMSVSSQFRSADEPPPSEGEPRLGLNTVLRRSASAVVAVQVVGIGLSYGVQLFLVRWAGASEYGLYVYVLAWVGVLATLASLGLPEAASRFIPEYAAQQDHARLRGFLRSSQRLTLWTSLGLAALGAAGAALWEDRAPLVLIGAGLLPVFALSALQVGLFRAFGRLPLAYALRALLYPALVLAGGAWLAQTDVRPSGAVLLGLAVPASLVPLLIRQRMLRSLVTPDVRRARPVPAYRDWFRVGFPLLLNGSFWMLLSRTDVLLLGFFASSSEVGMYAIAVRLAGGLVFMLNAVEGVAAPAFASLHARGRPEALQRFVTAAARWSLWPSLLAAAVLFAFGRPILRLFDPSFVEAWEPLMLLVAAQLFNAATGPVGGLLSMTGLQTRLTWIIAWTCGLNLALNAALIPPLGLFGAALATACSTVVYNAWLYASARRRLGIRSFFVAPRPPSA